MYTTEAMALVVGGLAEGGPAERAGVRLGDMVIEVAGEQVPGWPTYSARCGISGPPGTGSR